LQIRHVNGVIKGNAYFKLHYSKLEWATHLLTIYYYSISNLTSVHEIINSSTGLSSFQIWTRSLEALTLLHSQWFKYDLNLNKFIKIVPNNIGTLLGPIALAIWLQDDGSWNLAHNTVVISTHSFTLNECELLCSALKSNFNLIAKPNKDIILKNGSQSYRIRFSSQHENIIRLRETVLPYFIKSNYYKLGL
jgi:hypothetical protein